MLVGFARSVSTSLDMSGTGGMSGSLPFTALATRLAGLTAVHLGWTPDIFWAATPAELATIPTALAPEIGTALGTPDLATLMEIFPDG